MPAKRIIILNRVSSSMDTRAVLWADVPAGNQIAYQNPLAQSAYDNATPAEIQALRDGVVAEKLTTYNWTGSGTPLTAMQADLQSQWTQWQADVNAVVAWSDYGRVWDSTPAWQAPTGVPMAGTKEIPEGLPAFVALTPVSAFAANKFQFVLYNGAPAATSQGLVVKVRLLAILPNQAVVTGALPSVWTLVRRTGLTTVPSGAGSFSPALMDSAQNLPAGVTLFNAPAVAPAGGTTTLFNEFTPQADELKLTTADAPTLAALFSDFGGQVVYNASRLAPCRPLVVRAGQTLEVQQSTTAGTGNCRVLCVFTVG